MKRIISILLIIILLGIMTGCTSKFEVDGNVVRDITNKITETIIENVGNESAEKEETKTFDASKLNNLNIDSAVGNINITTHDSADVIIDIKIRASSNKKETAEELIKDFSYTAEEKWNTLNIVTSEQKDKLTSPNSITVDLTITIPSTIENIKITSNVGDINIENINGAIEVSSNVGDINIKNTNASYVIQSDVGDVKLYECQATEKSQFNLNVGDVNVSFKDISNAKNISIETQVGNIKISIPYDSNYEVEINEFMKEDRILTNGDGITKLKLVTNVGNITFK